MNHHWKRAFQTRSYLRNVYSRELAVDVLAAGHGMSAAGVNEVMYFL